jgi:hypothetical protein
MAAIDRHPAPKRAPEQPLKIKSTLSSPITVTWSINHRETCLPDLGGRRAPASNG